MKSISKSNYWLVMEEIIVKLSVNLLQSFKSICTDRELAPYIKIAVIHFIYNLLIYLPIVKYSYSLFVSCNNGKPILASSQNSQRIKAKMHSIIVAIIIIFTLKESSIPNSQLTDYTTLSYCSKNYNSSCRCSLLNFIMMLTMNTNY